MNFRSYTVITIIVLLIGCKKEEPVQIIAPVPVMYAATNQTSSTCEFYGSVEIEGSNAVVVKGYCWDLDTLPTLTDFMTENGKGPGTFDTTAYNLNAQTKYHVRAYAKTSAGVYYSLGVTFKTQ